MQLKEEVFEIYNLSLVRDSPFHVFFHVSFNESFFLSIILSFLR